MSATVWLMTARLPEPALVDAAIVGDARAVDELARAWLPHVYRWCHRLGGPGFDSEDAAHEVLIVMCRRLASLRDPDQFPSWLFGICRRVIANHRRRAWWKRWLPSALVGDRATPDRGPDQAFEAQESADQVWAGLAALEPAHREVLVLCDLEERSATEAAALLGIPVGTVKSRLRVARVSLRRFVEHRAPRAAEVP